MTTGEAYEDLNLVWAQILTAGLALVIAVIALVCVIPPFTKNFFRRILVFHALSR